jgi:hypothetical protein
MQKAGRARTQLIQPGRAAASRPALAADPRQSQVNVVADLLRLVDRAAHSGVRAQRVQRWRTALLTGRIPAELLTTYECRLRAWIARHRADICAVSRPGIY